MSITDFLVERCEQNFILFISCAKSLNHFLGQALVQEEITKGQPWALLAGVVLIGIRVAWYILVYVRPSLTASNLISIRPRGFEPLTFGSGGQNKRLQEPTPTNNNQ